MSDYITGRTATAVSNGPKGERRITPEDRLRALAERLEAGESLDAASVKMVALTAAGSDADRKALIDALLEAVTLLTKVEQDDFEDSKGGRQ